MPPLCTAGFGLATGNWSFFFGALFLYAINCVFICIATFLIVKYLNYPAVQILDQKEEKKIRYGISFLTGLILIPSVYFAFLLFKQQQFFQAVNQFISQEIQSKNLTLVQKNIVYDSKNPKIELALLQNQIPLEDLKEPLKYYQLEKAELKILTASDENLQHFKNDILNQLSKNEQLLVEKEKTIQGLQEKLNAADQDNILEELQVFLPQITAISFGQQKRIDAQQTRNEFLFFYQTNMVLKAEQELVLENFIRKKFQKTQVRFIAER